MSFSAALEQLSPPVVGPVSGREPAKIWRGILLDSARTRFSKTTVCKLLHLMSRYGYNRLHWHLTDDAGWRFRVPEYPRLTEVGSLLLRNSFEHYHCLAKDSVTRGLKEQDSKWKNGYYTDEEIAEIVETAQKLEITIMPELDLPGHMKAAIESYPELGRPKGLPLPKWGRPNLQPPEARLPAANDLLWPTDESLHFLRTVLHRVADLFPHSPIIHIGGDECALHQWETDPEMPTHLKRHNLKNEANLQQWFMDRAADYLNEKNRTIGVWDDVCESNSNIDALLFGWDQESGMERIRQATAPYVYADCRTLYFNRIDPTRPQQIGMLPGISIQDVLTHPWDEYYSNRCIGVQASAWAEFILDEAALFEQLFPRVLAVAERMWNPKIKTRPATVLEAEEINNLITQEMKLLNTVLAKK